MPDAPMHALLCCLEHMTAGQLRLLPCNHDFVKVLVLLLFVTLIAV